MKPFSFTFRGKNSRTEFGIMSSSYDFLMPPKRKRKQSIPFRHGSYDYGAEWYDDRILRLRCIWISSFIDKMQRSDVREISSWLSRKGAIYLDVEPDKHYIGELYNPEELIMHYQTRLNGYTSDGEFELNFLCEPFAYGVQNIVPIKQGINPIEYTGTADSPTLIILKNPNPFPITRLTVTAVSHIKD